MFEHCSACISHTALQATDKPFNILRATPNCTRTKNLPLVGFLSESAPNIGISTACNHAQDRVQTLLMKTFYPTMSTPFCAHAREANISTALSEELSTKVQKSTKDPENESSRSQPRQCSAQMPLNTNHEETAESSASRRIQRSPSCPVPMSGNAKAKRS